jgi:hypothetical protein
MRTIPPAISDIVNYNTMSQRKLFFGFVPAATLAACVKAGRLYHPSMCNKLPEERREPLLGGLRKR